MRTRTHSQHAFTLIELLTAVTIILLLIGIFSVVFASVGNKSKETITLSLMQTLKTGIDQFELDLGYQPPLLVPDLLASTPDSASTPYPTLYPDSFEFVDPLAQDDASETLRNARYFSTLSLATYLVGNCDLAPSSYSPANDPQRHDGAQDAGIRDPGPDRAWGGAKIRDDTTHRPALSGDIYGPYVDVGEGKSIRREYEFRPVTEYATFDALRLNTTTRSFYVFVDAWGNPIRYYRDLVKRDDDTGELSVIHAPVELLTSGLTQVSDQSMTKDQRMSILSTENKHITQSTYHLLSAGNDGFFATTSDPVLDSQFAVGSMPAGYSNDAVISAVIGTSPISYSRLVDSVSNNVRLSD
ncbi:MAG: type II secretion system protein [Phycisphaerales bacterium JB043]